MKATKVITVICWCISALALAGLAVWFVSGSVFGFSSFGRGNNWRIGNMFGFENVLGPYEVAGEHDVAALGINSVEIDWVAGDMSVMSYDGESIQFIEYAKRELRDDEKLRYSISGGTLKIEYRESKTGWQINTLAKNLEVLIPRTLSESLNVFKADSTSGGVNVERLAAEKFSVETTSGGIHISNITAQEIEADSTSGGITLSLVTADKIEAESTSGKIHISESVARELSCDATSGSMEISGAFDKIEADNSSGRILVENTAERSTLSAETTSGRIEASGSFDKVKADSSSGSIEITSRAVPSSVKADTTSGSITVAVPNEGELVVWHDSTSGRFTSDIPVIIQKQDARLELSTTSGNIWINEIR